MFKKKVKEPKVGAPEEKLTPAFLRADYPYKAEGEALNPEDCEDGTVYEIKCHQCEMSIRSQGQNIRSMWERLQIKGCIDCASKELKIYKVNMSKKPAQPITTEA